MAIASRRVASWTAGTAVILLTFGIFTPGLNGGFIFDDFSNLVSDSHWRLTALTLEGLREAIGNGFSGLAGRPLAMLSFALDHLRAGPDPSALKFTNIGLHALNALLVFFLVREISRITLSAQNQNTAGSTLLAAWVALAWSLHPLQTSTVLYIVQRMEIGAATGILLACLAYIQGRRRQIAEKRSWIWFAGVAIATLLGLGFKESAALSLIFIATIEVCILKFSGPRKTAQPLKLFFASIFVMALLIFTFVVIPHFSQPALYESRNFDLKQRVLTQGPVLVHYLSQIILPIPNRLVFYYDNFPLSDSLLAPAWTLSAWIILSALALAAILFRERYPLASFGVAWFFTGHLLTSNVVPLEIAFEHRNYLALLGVLLVIAEFGTRFLRPLNLDARIVIASVVMAALCLLTSLQVMTWADPMRLATALASRNVDSSRASYALGRLLFEQSNDDTRSASWSLAKSEFMHASQLDTYSPLPEQALIIMHARDGTTPPTSTWSRLQRKFADHKLTPESEGALWQLAACRQLAQCPLDAKALFEVFIVALERNPDSARLHSMYATFAFTVMHDQELAVGMMREAVALAPNDPQFKANLARMISCNRRHRGEWSTLMATLRAENSDPALKREIREIEAFAASCRQVE